jgi:peptidoglycan hydrolase-like protein with peptidoglycan-binding domain
LRLLAGAAGVAAVVAAGGVFAAEHARAGTHPGATLPARGTVKRSPTRAGAHVTRHPKPPATPPVPLSVRAITPATGTAGVPATSAVTVRFSAPLTSGATYPTLSPAVPGSWQRSAPDALTFTPAQHFVPGTTVHVTVPAGIAARNGTTLTAATSASFTVASGSTLRLQQLLAQLNYLPVSFSAPLSSEPTSPGAIALSPQPGQFHSRFATAPAQLMALWSPGSANEVTTGAVMAFEREHGLATDGIAGPEVWTALLSAVAARQTDPRPYTYLIATETLPETLYVWSDGQTVLHSLTNTGVPGATTPQGTWPVDLRYVSTTMIGTDPNGYHYVDPGIPWVSYFNGGIAVHGYVRASYGFPQSNGCVELPIPVAKQVYPYDPIGTLVTVTSGNLNAEMLNASPATTTTAPASGATTSTSTPATSTTTAPASGATTSTSTPATSTTTAPASGATTSTSTTAPAQAG